MSYIIALVELCLFFTKMAPFEMLVFIPFLISLRRFLRRILVPLWQVQLWKAKKKKKFFFNKADLSFLPYLPIYSVISLYRSGLMDIYFTLCIIIQTLLFMLCSPCSSLGCWEFSQLTFVSCWHTPSLWAGCCFLSISLFSGTTRWSMLIFYVFLTSPWIHHIPRDIPGSFYCRMVLGTKIWVLDVLVGCCFF